MPSRFGLVALEQRQHRVPDRVANALVTDVDRVEHDRQRDIIVGAVFHLADRARIVTAMIPALQPVPGFLPLQANAIGPVIIRRSMVIERGTQNIEILV